MDSAPQPVRIIDELTEVRDELADCRRVRFSLEEQAGKIPRLKYRIKIYEDIITALSVNKDCWCPSHGVYGAGHSRACERVKAQLEEARKE